TINPTNGLFSWTPAESQSPSTNQITAVVTDNGFPSLSDSKSFMVTVLTPLKIKSLGVTNQLVTITWLSISGRTYRVQYQDVFATTNWDQLSPDIIANSPEPSATNAVSSAGQRFYRIVLLP